MSYGSNKIIATGNYVVKIKEMTKFKSKKGEWWYKLGMQSMMGPGNEIVCEEINDYIRITDYKRLLEVQKAFITLDFNSLETIIGCDGLIKYNKGYITYIDVRALAAEENIDIE